MNADERKAISAADRKAEHYQKFAAAVPWYDWLYAEWRLQIAWGYR